LDPVLPQLNVLKEEFRNHFDHVRVEPNKTAAEISLIIKEFLETEGNKPDACLLIYYSGHGYTETDLTTGAVTGYITGRNTPAIDETKAGYDRARPKAISMGEIRLRLRDSKAKSVLFMFDSCFSGSFFLDRAPPQRSVKMSGEEIQDLMSKSARRIITAGNSVERVPASSPIPGYVLSALHGEADRFEDGTVTAQELSIYLKRMLRNRPQLHLHPQDGALPEYPEGEFFFRVQPGRPSVDDALVEGYKESASQGDLIATNNLAEVIKSNNNKVRFDPEAIKLYTSTALRGDPTGQYALGIVNRDGIGRERDLRKAVEWFRRAADQKLPAAQAALGDMYERGGGGLLRGDFKSAFKLYADAADQEDAYAMNKLGEYYYYGRGVGSTDQPKAVKLFEGAASQGNAAAMANLGYAYLNGRGGLNPSKDIARKLFEQASAQGDGMGQENLAYMYEKGWGNLKPDMKEALRLYQLAANQGFRWAQDQIDRINGRTRQNGLNNLPSSAGPGYYNVRCWWDGLMMRYACY
jgi:TPR repeat protein